MSGDTPRDDAALPPHDDRTAAAEQPAPPVPAATSAEPTTCDYCGTPDLVWIRCKLVCRNCHQINLSCSDL